MSTDVGTLVSAPISGRARPVHLDHLRYARAVILQGQPIPWDQPVAFSKLMGQAQGLLRPDSTLLDLGAFYEHALGRSASLVAALSARSRTGFALKALLADESTAREALELALVVSHTSRAPLMLQIPSPLWWLARMHELSGAGTAAELDAGHAENAAMYVAGWLRRFADLPVQTLLLDERWAGPGQLHDLDPAAYTPVTNLADHYRWTVARRRTESLDVLGSTISGTVVPADFWCSEDEPAGGGDFLLADIPADAPPELVLSQLAKLT
ncbi:MAG: hypothetical protein JWO88_2061 [Frankiales bacterium]|nr:hypothetical protein [Frankiales bacterium]